jgi:RHS repeat-associated protein
MKTHLQIIGLCTACCIGTLKADSFCGNPQGPSSPPTIDPYTPTKDPTNCTTPSPAGGVNTFNPFTGNLHREVTDIQVFGSVGEIPLELRRTTTSRYMGGVATPFASSGSWRHNWQWQLIYGGTNGAGQEIINVYYPDGRNELFSKASASAQYLTAVSRVSERVRQASATDYNLIFTDGSQLYFTKSGTGANTRFTPQGLNDRFGQWYPFNTDAKGRVTRVTEPGGRYLELQYGPVGHFSVANVEFSIPASAVPQATSVVVAGDFNGWSTSASPLTLINGTWRTTIPLQLGAWQYKFVINGNTWIPDPSNPDHAPPGPGNNSVINVSLGDEDTDPAGQTPVEFVYESSSAASVSVAGSFNGWNSTSHALTKTGNTWRLTLPIGAGSHLYKFVINGGTWAPDPANPFKAPDGYGGHNSRLAVGPLEEAVLRVQTSDGRGVDYRYGMETSGWTIYGKLTRADYGDGTSALYSYVLPYNRNGRPLIGSVDDPRYPGSATRISYTYQNTGVDGFIHQEKSLTGATLVTLETPSATERTIVWANGLVEQLVYNGVQLVSRGNTTTGTSTASFFDNGFGMKSGWTAANGGTTAYQRTWEFGAIKSTTLPGGATRSRTFTDESRPFYVATETDELGRVTTTTRDSANRPVRIDHPDGTYETFSYNGFGQVAQHRHRNGGIESFTYNASGQMTARTDALGHTTTHTYHTGATSPAGLMASATDPRGFTTSFLYNDRGQLTRITNPDGSTRLTTYDAYGNTLSRTDELGNTWSTSYDAFRRPLTQTDPLGRVTAFSYDIPGACGCPGAGLAGAYASAKPSRITSPAGRITEIYYDATWREISRIQAPNTPDQAVTLFAYDAAGNLASVTDPLGRVTTSTFDVRNRRLSTTDPLGHTTSWTYDAVGNVLTTTFADSTTASTTYDAMNRPLTSTDALGQTTTYTYHPDGSLASLTDARASAYTFVVDALSRRTRMNYPGGSYETWTYDGNSNMTQYRTRAGVTMSCTFDNRNRDTFCDWSDSTPDVTKTYDAAGRVLSISNSVAASAFTYDAAHQMLSESITISGLSGAKTVAYTYDADGNRASLTDPNGSVIAYSNTARGQVASIVADGPPPLATFAYDAAGRRTSRTLENGLTSTYTYDDDGRLTSLAHGSLETLTYTYDAMHRRTGEARSSAPARTFGYDLTGQLIAVNQSTGNATFAYDAVGNRTIVTGAPGAGSYTANNLNQYTTAGGVGPLTYDANGNLATVGGWAYTHNGNSRLVGVSGPSTVTATFGRDGRNRDVKRTINGTTTYLIYDGWNLVAEYDAAGVLTTRYVHGPQVDEILAKVTTTSTTFPLPDALGSTIAVTDASGAVVERVYYSDAFGAPTFKNASGTTLSGTSTGTRFLFTGREWLAALNLYDYRNRTYLAEVGRFVQADPIRFRGGDVNLYRYVFNHPTALMDPTGLLGVGGVALEQMLGRAAAGAVAGGLLGGAPGAVVGAAIGLLITPSTANAPTSGPDDDVVDPMEDPDNWGDPGLPERLNPREKADRDCQDELAKVECREGAYSDAEQSEFMRQCMREKGFDYP